MQISQKCKMNAKTCFRNGKFNLLSQYLFCDFDLSTGQKFHFERKMFEIVQLKKKIKKFIPAATGSENQTTVSLLVFTTTNLENSLSPCDSPLQLPRLHKPTSQLPPNFQKKKSKKKISANFDGNGNS